MTSLADRGLDRRLGRCNRPAAASGNLTLELHVERSGGVANLARGISDAALQLALAEVGGEVEVGVRYTDRVSRDSLAHRRDDKRRRDCECGQGGKSLQHRSTPF